jgi:hypothetical protein
VQTPLTISHSGLVARSASVARARVRQIGVARQGIGQGIHIHRLGGCDFRRGAAAHEQRLAAPLEDDLLARLDRGKIDLVEPMASAAATGSSGR